jgi:hypothetical protein
MASIKVAEFLRISEAEPDTIAREISYLWDNFNQQRRPKIEEWKELRNYVFATDTSKTSNSSLPWKNKTTLPKLCQIRDNLHSNYISALFPNDEWLRWEGYTRDDALLEKAEAIEGYMRNKTRIGHFRTEMSKCLYDYIDYGNAFMTVNFESRFKEAADGSQVPEFIGPKLIRISPLDIVFNPTASSFAESFKIIRSIKTIGELKQMAEDEPDNAYLQEALARRERISKNMDAYTIEDTDKAEGFSLDGYGNLQEYYQSGYVEILEFWGDYHNQQTGDLQRNKVITVVDRSVMIRNADIPSWTGGAPIHHVGWRSRTDNLWAMGPLDNLVGLQYRIDHLENLKADAMDIAVLPPLKVIGEVEQFRYGPGVKIHMDDGGDVQELGKNAQWVITAANEISAIETRMEQYAGAPSEAMGIRTPGEKTAFEVSQLQNAAGRIFQEKITHFEIEGLEPTLNDMLETARRNLDANDVIRVMDDDVGVVKFIEVTREDITASGKIRPMGARHFAAQAQLMQNLNMLMNSAMAERLAPHTSSIALSKLVEDALNIQRYDLFSPNIGVFEQQETQRAVNGAQEELMVDQEMAMEEDLP